MANGHTSLIVSCFGHENNNFEVFQHNSYQYNQFTYLSLSLWNRLAERVWELVDEVTAHGSKGGSWPHAIDGRNATPGLLYFIGPLCVHGFHTYGSVMQKKEKNNGGVVTVRF